MDAVVVARAEVERGEAAVLELLGQLAVAANQRGRRVAVALGLENLVAVDGTELADGAIDRADEVGIGLRPGAILERPREEFVEALVAGDVRIGCLGHIDVVTTDEPADDAGCQSAGLFRRQLAGEDGQRLFRDQVLGQDGKAVGHGRIPIGEWAAIIPGR